MWQEFIVDECVKINKMYSLFEYNYEKGYLFPGETHDFWECMYVEKGTVHVTCDERVYLLKAGEIIFHSPLTLHKFSLNDDCGASGFVFSFELSGKMAAYFKNKVFNLNDEQHKIMLSLSTFLHNSCPDYKDNKKKRNIHFLQQGITQPINLHIITTYITQLILFLHDDHDISVNLNSFDAEIFKKAVEFMKENISHHLSVKQIALHCQINVTALKNIFTKHAGMGIHKYFLTLKISAAELELKKGRTVTEVSDMLGFNSQSYFSAAFKREKGYSPSQQSKKRARDNPD